MYEIRDPIHGTISFSEREKQVVDHEILQRMRHIRQLGLSYLVYPGSTHDRFSHSIGAMHVVSRIWDRIMETSGGVLRQHFEDFDLQYFRRILRLAGLLHDIGHPPLSHVSEHLMPPLDQLGLPGNWMTDDFASDRQSKHEDYSVLLIDMLSRGQDSPLPRDEAQDIASLIHHQVSPSPAWLKKLGEPGGGHAGIHGLLRSLISGELDCDRMDYLLRDAYFTGVTYGMYDMDHLINNLGVAADSGRLVPTIDSTAVRAFEDFLLARYHMFLQVYLHKTTLAFDWYLQQAMKSGEVELKIPASADRYVRLRDSTLTERIFAAADKNSNSWSARLISRTPPKTLFRASNQNPADSKMMSRLTRSLDRFGVSYFKINSRQYLSVTNPAGNQADKNGLMVRRKMFGHIVFESVEKYSELLNKYNEVIDISNIYVLRENEAAAQKIIHGLSWPLADDETAGEQARFLA